MENQSDNGQKENRGSGFMVFATKRIIISAVLIVLLVWVLGIGLDSCGNKDETLQTRWLKQNQVPGETALQEAQDSAEPLHQQHETAGSGHSEAAAEQSRHTAATPDDNGDVGETPAAMTAQSHAPTKKPAPPAIEKHSAESAQTPANALEHPAETRPHAAAPETPKAEPLKEVVRPKGVTFVEALIKPLDYELNKRFWGWRPNDILNFTDNVNNFQLGVLEVSRRSVVMLTERISRTGTTDAFNQHLEDAANWLMVTATRYWFPSPESKYRECLKELSIYREELISGRGSFYTRTDNLIPLLSSYEDLLGSCDENLVKRKNEDGSPVSYFKADDYFYYAQGVASTMATILEAVHHDFLQTLESRHGTELLHHAILSCQQAAQLRPLLITDMALDGIFANHRANMAAPISHARFYIGQLIKTLST